MFGYVHVLVVGSTIDFDDITRTRLIDGILDVDVVVSNRTDCDRGRLVRHGRDVVVVGMPEIDIVIAVIAVVAGVVTCNSVFVGLR